MRRGSERTRQGTLERAEILSLFDRGYGLGTRRFIAESWGLDGDADPEDVADLLVSRDAVEEKFEEITGAERMILGAIAAADGRVRGENLRRDLVLKGYEKAGDVLKSLVSSCTVIVIPNPGESDLDVENLLEQNTFLQRDIALTPPMFNLLDEVSDVIEDVEARWSGEVEVLSEGSLDTLELNLVHLGSLLRHEALRLNKSGTPNRRSLVRFAHGISLPGEPGEAAEELDLNDPLQMDYLTFLLAFGLELGLFEQKDQYIEGDSEAIADYFTSSLRNRLRRLLDALRNLKYWSELKSKQITTGLEDREEQLSQFEPTGQPLIGARGYVLSVLKRSQIDDWTPISNIEALCRQIDEDYLPHVLGKLDAAVDVATYLDAVLRRLLLWTGAVDLGHGDGGTVVRLTNLGAAMIGTGKLEQEEETVEEGCLVVQPNLEIMLFLDSANLEVAYRIYQISERRKLSDRVANFIMTPETVQRGYASGTTAEATIELLNKYSHAPVPESIEFQLKDWERIHRRLTLFADGILLRHRDPDALDLVVGQLEHENRGELDFVHLGPASVFIPSTEPKGLERAVERNDALVIDYLGEIPASLYFIDPLVLMVDPIECDVVTSSVLGKIAVEQEDSLPTSKFYEIDLDMVERRWPEETLEHLVEFLDPRCDGGLPAGQYLLLRSELEAPPSADIRRNTTVVVVENEEVADILLRVDEAEGLVKERLGPRTFEIVEDGADEFQVLLEELGILV